MYDSNDIANCIQAAANPENPRIKTALKNRCSGVIIDSLLNPGVVGVRILQTFYIMYRTYQLQIRGQGV